MPGNQGSEVGSHPEMYPHSIAASESCSLLKSTLSEAKFSTIRTSRLDFGIVIHPKSWQNLMATWAGVHPKRSAISIKSGSSNLCPLANGSSRIHCRGHPEWRTETDDHRQGRHLADRVGRIARPKCTSGQRIPGHGCSLIRVLKLGPILRCTHIPSLRVNPVHCSSRR